MAFLVFLVLLLPQELRKPRIEVSPDGTWAAALDSRGGLRAWPMDNPKAGRTFPTEAEHPAQALSFSPDGTILVTGHRGGALKIWDLPTGALIRTIPASPDLPEIRSLAVLPPDGAGLIVGGPDGGLRRYDRQSGREILRTKPQDVEAGGPLWFSKDGRVLATRDSRRQLILLDARTLTRRNAPELQLADPAALAFAPDGKALCATASDGRLMMVDLQHGSSTPLAPKPSTKVESLAFDEKGRQVVALDHEGRVRRYDAWSLAELAGDPRTPLTRGGGLTVGTLSLDGTRVATFEENKTDAPLTVNHMELSPMIDAPAAGPEKFVRVPLFYGTNRQPREVDGSVTWHALRFLITGGGLKYILTVVVLLAISGTLSGPCRKLWNQPSITAKQAFLIVGMVGLALLLGWVICTRMLSFRSLNESLFSLGILSLIPLTLLVLHRSGDGIILRIVVLVGMGLLLISAGALLDGVVRSRAELAGRGQHFNAENAGKLIVGTCEVTVPLATHRRGMIDQPLVAGIQFELADPDRHMIVADVRMEELAPLMDRMRHRVTQSPRKEAFVFVHGYNVTFEDAALRTAQIAHDIEFPGVPIFFSWPSQGTIAGYPWDSDAVEGAVAHFQDFLKTVALESGAETIHLVAHSMGNRLLTKVLKDLSGLPDADRIRKPFREIILAAPDISATVFETQYVEPLVARYPHVTLYANSNDRALMASRAYNHSRRAGDSGDAEICVYRKLDSIDVSSLETDMDGHGYFGTNHVVLCDMYSLIKEGKPAEARYRMEHRSRKGLPYYLFSQ